jgi:hypothetical protein
MPALPQPLGGHKERHDLVANKFVDCCIAADENIRRSLIEAI